MTQFKKTKLQNLKGQIAATREELNSIWAARGCTDAVVIAVAAKLDKLCNEYQRLLSKIQAEIENKV